MNANWKISVTEDENQSWLRLDSPDGKSIAFSAERGSIRAQVLQDYAISMIQSTPPEVEPVGIVTRYEGVIGAVMQQRMSLKTGDLLYTRPPAPNDELKAAAEDAQLWLDALGTHECSGVDPQTKRDILALSEKLRSALGKKEGE